MIQNETYVYYELLNDKDKVDKADKADKVDKVDYVA